MTTDTTRGTTPDIATGERVVRAACSHDCQDACAMLVTVRDGVAVKVGPNPAHPVTGNHLCVKVNRYLERVYSPDRVMTPLRRVGAKGEGRFEAVTWEAAVEEIGERWEGIIAADGAAAILPYSYFGSMGVLSGLGTMEALFRRLGASDLERTICGGQRVGLTTLVGEMTNDPESLVEARLIVAWGFNLVQSSVHTWEIVRAAQRRGARLVVVDPYRSRTAQQADTHLAVYPGTDGALALGMLHVILEEGLEDADYVARYTSGVEELRAHVAEWTPERTAAVTGLEAEEVREFARAYATTQPAGILPGVGMQRAYGAGMALRAIQCLPALTGQWRQAAGGVSFAHSFESLRARRLTRTPGCGPPPRRLNMLELGRDLTDATLSPPVRSLYVWNSNPAVIAPEQRKVVAGLEREDLFTVVHDQFVTDTARYADIVLPATTMLEQADVTMSWGFNYVQRSEQAIAPVGESRPNSEVARLLAARLGFDEALFQMSDTELLDEALRDSPAERAGAREALAAQGFARVEPAGGVVPFAAGGFPGEDGRFAFVSKALAKGGLGPLPLYLPPAEEPQPGGRYPLRLLTLKRHRSLNSSYGGLPVLTQHEPEPLFEMHPADAASRGIGEGEGERVRVFNDRGSLAYGVVINAGVKRGTVAAPFGHWGVPGVNTLTSARLGDIGSGATLCDVAVEVERAVEVALAAESERA